MGMLKEFKEFAFKGNLIDIAVGFVMGAAFKEVVTAFTGGIVAPLIGMLFNTDMRDWKYLLKETTGPDGKVKQIWLEYGTFLTALVDFIIIAFVMFLFVKAVNNMKKKEEEAPAGPPEPTAEEKLLTEIRDLLKKN